MVVVEVQAVLLHLQRRLRVLHLKTVTIVSPQKAAMRIKHKEGIWRI